MSILVDFAERFKAKDVPIERWYSDDVGRYAFRVTVGTTTFVCTARKSQRYDGRLSCFTKIAEIARDYDAVVVIRVRDDVLVFDPDMVLERGWDTSGDSPTRAKRGERWVEFDIEWGVPLEEYIDGVDAPATPAGLDAFR